MSGSGDEDDGWADCDLCGRPVGQDWIALEVSRPVPPPHVRDGHEVSDTDCVHAVFCSQEHAARWVERPLPPLAPWRMGQPSRRSRAVEGAALAGGVFVAALGAVGFTTLVRFLLDTL